MPDFDSARDAAAERSLAFMFWIRAHLDRRSDEDGVSVVEWVVISAIVVLLAGVILAILQVALTDEANEVQQELQNF